MRISGPRTGPACSAQRAFTLTELLIVCTIAAILLGVGVPGLASILARSGSLSAMLELRGLLEGARQHALSYQSTVTLCGTSDGFSCSSHWFGKPTLVFEDLNQNRRADPGENIIAVSELTRSGAIRWRASGGRSYLRFQSDGGVREYGNFQYCPRDRDARAARQLILSATGRPRAAIDSNGDGVVEGSDGRPVVCE